MEGVQRLADWLQLTDEQSTAGMRLLAHQALSPFRVLELRGPPGCRTDEQTPADIEEYRSRWWMKWAEWPGGTNSPTETLSPSPTTNIGHVVHLTDPGGRYLLWFFSLSSDFLLRSSDSFSVPQIQGRKSTDYEHLPRTSAGVTVAAGWKSSDTKTNGGRPFTASSVDESSHQLAW